MSGNYIATSQALALLSDVFDPDARVVLAVVVFHRLADAANSYLLCEALSQGEYERLTAAIGARTFACRRPILAPPEHPRTNPNTELQPRDPETQDPETRNPKPWQTLIPTPYSLQLKSSQTLKHHEPLFEAARRHSSAPRPTTQTLDCSTLHPTRRPRKRRSRIRPLGS
jgi:hypothetical protein